MSGKSELLAAFIRDVEERPYDLIPGIYTIRDKETGREWWTASGRFGLYLPYEKSVGIFRNYIARYYVDKLRTYHLKSTLERPAKTKKHENEK